MLLQSACRHQIKVPLINVPLSLADNKLNFKIFPEIFIKCATVDNLVNDLLLSVSVYDELKGSVLDNIYQCENNANYWWIGVPISIMEKGKRIFPHKVTSLKLIQTKNCNCRLMIRVQDLLRFDKWILLSDILVIYQIKKFIYIYTYTCSIADFPAFLQ